MSFVRHVGKIGDRKVAVLFREVPEEPHMALVAFTETLNMHIHDPMMKCIESEIGQNSENLADALNRAYTRDGKIILQVLHSSGFIRKVQTSSVLMTPGGNTTIRLDELNKILNEMNQGENAIKRLQEIDESRGMQMPEDVKRRAKELREKVDTFKSPQPQVIDPPSGILGDSQLANSLRQQAMKMHNEAKGLLAESDRLMKEAAQMEGISLETQPTVQAPTPKKRGRPAKAKVLV